MGSRWVPSRLIADAGLAHLATLDQLEEVVLKGTDVSAEVAAWPTTILLVNRADRAGRATPRARTFSTGLPRQLTRDELSSRRRVSSASFPIQL